MKNLILFVSLITLTSVSFAANFKYLPEKLCSHVTNHHCFSMVYAGEDIAHSPLVSFTLNETQLA